MVGCNWPALHAKQRFDSIRFPSWRLEAIWWIRGNDLKRNPEITPILDCAIIPTKRTSPTQALDDHQDGMQPPCPPQHVFSVYVYWPVSRHSEPPTPETDENRLSAHRHRRPRPPRRLELHRKATTQSSKWVIANIWQADRPIWCKCSVAKWECYSVRTHKSRKTPPPSQNSTIRFRRKNGPQDQCDIITRKNPLEVTIQLWIFRYNDTTGAIDVLLLRFGCQ